MSFEYLAVLAGGLGPDVWDKELEIHAVNFMEAAKQAQAKADELNGQVVSLEQTD